MKKKILYGVVGMGLIFILAYGIYYITLENSKNIKNTDVVEVQETVSILKLKENIISESENEEICETEDADIYRIFYGTWKFTEVVSEHERLGGMKDMRVC